MAMQGPLQELGIHDVFQLLDLGRKTGVLRIVSDLRQNEGTIWFENAAVVAASIRSNPHPFGAQLLKAGKIGAEDLARAHDTQANGNGRRIGEILVAMGALTERELAAQVRVQIEEVVFTLLGWSEGFFVFEEESAGSIPREADVRISVGALLLESARRIDEWSLIRTKIGHLSVVPRLTSNPGEPGSLVLTPFEWRVLAACDGIRDVQSIAVTLGEPEFDVARALFGLVVAGVVQVRDPVAESTARAPRSDAEPLLGHAEQLIRSRNYEAARETAQVIAATFPDDPRGSLVLGRTFLAERRFAEAEAPLREAVRLDPGSPRALRLLSWALLGAGRLDESVHGFEAWLAWPALGADEEQQVSAVGAAIPAARQLAALLRGAHD